MTIKGLRRVIEDTVLYTASGTITQGGVWRMSTDAADVCLPAGSGASIFLLGIGRETVIARPAGPLAGTAGGTFTESTPLFQEAGTRYVGEKVSVIKRGTIVTDQINEGSTPTIGHLAYAGSGALIATTGNLVIGRFETAKDSDGFARVFIDIGMQSDESASYTE
jgi:hypothetical protein